MSFNEESRTIFEMLQQGKITVDEAQKLFETIASESRKSPYNGTLQKRRFSLIPKCIRVNVTEHGTSKVRVTVPFALVRYGLKLGRSLSGVIGRFAKNDDVVEILNEVDIDEILQSLEDGEAMLPLTIVEVDVEEDDVQVTVILE